MSSEQTQPFLVFQILNALGVAKGVELFEVNSFQTRKFLEHTLRTLIKALLFFHEVARQCNLLAGQFLVTARMLLLNEQHFEFLLIETEYNAVYGNIHHVIKG